MTNISSLSSSIGTSPAMQIRDAVSASLLCFSPREGDRYIMASEKRCSQPRIVDGEDSQSGPWTKANPTFWLPHIHASSSAPPQLSRLCSITSSPGNMRLFEGWLLQSKCGTSSAKPLEGAPGAGAAHLDAATSGHVIASLR